MRKNMIKCVETATKSIGHVVLLSVLNNYKQIITEHLNNSKNNLAAGEANTQNNLLEGDYYDIYIKKRDEWIDDIKQIQNLYADVLASIENYIELYSN